VQDAKGADWESTSFILLFGSFGCPVPWSRREHSSRAALTTGYIGEFEIIDDHRGGKIVIQLNGRLNKTGVISPRFNVGVDAIENWVNLLLPARSFGKIILTTSSGIMDHEEARRKHVSANSDMCAEHR